jgi:hypothetical protein
VTTELAPLTKNVEVAPEKTTFPVVVKEVKVVAPVTSRVLDAATAPVKVEAPVTAKVLSAVIAPVHKKVPKLTPFKVGYDLTYEGGLFMFDIANEWKVFRRNNFILYLWCSPSACSSVT